MAIEQGYVYGMLNLAMLYAEKKMHFSNLIMRVRAGPQAFQVSQKNPRDVRLRGGWLYYSALFQRHNSEDL